LDARCGGRAVARLLADVSRSAGKPALAAHARRGDYDRSHSDEGGLLDLAAPRADRARLPGRVLQPALRDQRHPLFRAAHLRPDRGARRRPGHGHLGAHLRDLPEPLPRGGPIAGQRDSLGVRRAAHYRVPADGQRVPPGDHLPLLLWHDGTAARLGADDGSGNQGRATGGDPTPPRPLIVGAGEVLWDLFPDGDHFGGAPANVVVHAAALGADAALVSAVGRDARGDAALERLAAGRVDCTAVSRLAGHPTGVVHVRIDAAGLPSYDIAVGSAWDFIPWTALVERAAQRADAICFGTLAQASAASRATIRRAVAATREAAWRLFDV